MFFQKMLIFQNKPWQTWTLQACLNLTLSAFADMNFGPTFPVQTIPSQICLNFMISKNAKYVPPWTWAEHFIYQISCSQ